MKNVEENTKFKIIKKIYAKKLSRQNSMSSTKSTKKNISSQNNENKEPMYKNLFSLKKKIQQKEKRKIKNSAEYMHLLATKDQSQIDWSINLREYNNNIQKKSRNLKPPSFYDEDEQKFKKKNLTKSKSLILLNYNEYRHLLSNKPNRETISMDTLNFETSLRKFQLKHDNSVKHLNKWNNRISKSIFNSTNYLPISDKLNENYIMRPYKILRKNVSFGDYQISQKNYVKNDKFAYNWFGTHLSEPPYNNIFKGRNYFEIENILNGKEKNRFQCLFQFSLRNQYEKKINKK